MMTRVATSGRCILFVIAWLALAGGCAKMMTTGITSLKPRNMTELQGYLLNHKPDLDYFTLRGPFAVAEQHNYEIRLSTTEIINSDLYLSAHAEKAPLVIFMHGYDSSKDDHAFQAQHVASWGMHCLALQLPNSGQWANNGQTLAKLVKFIYRWPEIVDSRIDVNKIILVGHSFGAASVAIALAEGAPAGGSILLDPAAIGRNLPDYLRKINKPTMLLGADEHLSVARNREYFYQFIRSGVAEVSIKDAVHEDAQFPSRFAVATEASQVAFVSALTSAAFSLSSTGKFDYAWTSFDEALANGKFFNPKKK